MRNIYISGRVTMDVGVLGGISHDKAYAARFAIGSAAYFNAYSVCGRMWQEASAFKDIGFYKQKILSDIGRDTTINSKTPLCIAYIYCRAVIVNRKMISDAFDSYEEILSRPMTIDEAVGECTKMMTFNDESIDELKSSLLLKLVDYLLGYECMISFLREFDDQYRLYIDIHSQLVRRLDLEDVYAKLFVFGVKLDEMTKYLPTIPVVLIEVILGYCLLTQDDPGDSDEIYNRLLSLDELKIPDNS